MESTLDQRYRLLLISKLEGFEESVNRRYKAKFFCPICQLNRDKKKYAQKKGAMFWHKKSNSWRFNCANNKCVNSGVSMYNYLNLNDQRLAKEYQTDRWHSGTTGWGHDCPSPR